MQWIIDNKEWVFSGFGAIIFSAVVAFFTGKKIKHDIQHVKNSDGNVNIQTGSNSSISVSTNEQEAKESKATSESNPHAKYVDNLSDFFSEVTEERPVEISVAINKDGRALLFYSHPFKVHLRHIEFFCNERRLMFISDRNTSRYFGMPLDETVAQHLEHKASIHLIRLDKDRNPTATGTIELVIYR